MNTWELWGVKTRTKLWSGKGDITGLGAAMTEHLGHGQDILVVTRGDDELNDPIPWDEVDAAPAYGAPEGETDA